MSLALILCDFMRYKVIYKSTLLAIKGNDESHKGARKEVKTTLLLRRLWQCLGKTTLNNKGNNVT